MAENFHNKRPSTRNSQTYKTAWKYKDNLFCNVFFSFYILTKTFDSSGYSVIIMETVKNMNCLKHFKNIYDKTGVITHRNIYDKFCKIDKTKR